MAPYLHFEGCFGIGCQIDYASSIQGLILKEFFLLLSSSGLAYRRCELAWVNGDQIGVKFITVGGGRKKSRGKKAVETLA
jgi:hypothetical protein